MKVYITGKNTLITMGFAIGLQLDMVSLKRDHNKVVTSIPLRVFRPKFKTKIQCINGNTIKLLNSSISWNWQNPNAKKFDNKLPKIQKITTL